jgi:hypothetical protein
MTGKVIDSLWPANNFLTHILQEIDSKLYTVPGTGRTVTLQMLLSANVLTPGKSLMSIEYLVRISRLRRLDLNLTESILLKIGTKVRWRPTARRQDQISRDGNDFLFALRLGHPLQADHQSGQEVWVWMGIGQVQGQEAGRLQGHLDEKMSDPEGPR